MPKSQCSTLLLRFSTIMVRMPPPIALAPRENPNCTVVVCYEQCFCANLDGNVKTGLNNVSQMLPQQYTTYFEYTRSIEYISYCEYWEYEQY